MCLLTRLYRCGKIRPHRRRTFQLSACLENLPFLSSFHYWKNGFAYAFTYGIIYVNIYVNIYWIAFVLIVSSFFYSNFRWTFIYYITTSYIKVNVIRIISQKYNWQFLRYKIDGTKRRKYCSQREARNATLIFSSAEMNAKVDLVNLRVRFIDALAQFAVAMKARSTTMRVRERAWYLCHRTSAVLQPSTIHSGVLGPFEGRVSKKCSIEIYILFIIFEYSIFPNIFYLSL